MGAPEQVGGGPQPQKDSDVGVLSLDQNCSVQSGIGRNTCIVPPLSDTGCRFLPPARMHLALKAYQELLLTVNEMDRSRDDTIRQSSNVIKSTPSKIND